MDEPFWETESRTEGESLYCCEYIGEFYGDQPNCFSEALERDGMIVSFRHSDFQAGEIEIIKNGREEKIYNLFNKISTGKALFLKGLLGFSELLLSGLENEQIVFYANKEKYYAEEYYENGQLSKMNVLAIQKDFQMFIHGRKNGTVLSRFSDSITHKGLTYC